MVYVVNVCVSVRVWCMCGECVCMCVSMLDFPYMSFPPSAMVSFNLSLAVLLKKYEKPV